MPWTGFLVKSFGKYCESTVLAATCYWPSSHYIPAQMFVPKSAELNHNRSPCVLDSDKGVCCHHSLSVFISGFQPGDRDPQRGCEPYLDGSYTAVLHLLYSSFRWGSFSYSGLV